MKYLGLWSLELRNFFEKFVKQSGPASYILNVRSLISEDDCSRVALVVGMTKSKLKYWPENLKYCLLLKIRELDEITVFYAVASLTIFP